MSAEPDLSPMDGLTPATPDNTGDTHGLLQLKAQPYFTRAEVTQYLSESRRNVMSNKDQAVRTQWCDFIEAVGKKLGYPQSTINAAQVLYNRFYLFHSVKDYPASDISTTCIYMASKVEETYKKLKDILLAAYAIRHPNGPEVNSDGQWVEDQRRKIVGFERLMLETQCFDFQMKHPCKYVIKFIKKFEGDRNVALKAWKIVNDCYKTTACLRFPPHTIAASAIYLAARFLQKEDFPPINLNGTPWYTYCLSRIEDIDEICHLILDLYMQGLSNPNDPKNEEFKAIKIGLNQLAAEREIDRMSIQRESSASTISRESLPPFNISGEKYQVVRYLIDTDSYIFPQSTEKPCI